MSNFEKKGAVGGLICSCITEQKVIKRERVSGGGVISLPSIFQKMPREDRWRYLSLSPTVHSLTIAMLCSSPSTLERAYSLA